MGHPRQGSVGDEAGVAHQDLVPLLDDGGDGEEERFAGAARHHDLPWGIVEAVLPPKLL